MSRLDSLLGAFGVLATLFGVGLAFAPDLFLVGPVPDLTDRVAETGTVTLMLGAGLAATLLTVVAARPRRGASTASGENDVAERFDGSVFDPDPDTDDAPDLLGADVTTAIEEGGESWAGVRSRLAATAVETYASAVGATRDDARRAVVRGDWTDDSLAAGAVTGNVPVAARLRLWLVPRRERRRRVERTVSALERLQER